MTDAALAARPALVRRGLWLNYPTIAYNTVEAVVSITAGLVAGSVALLGFGGLRIDVPPTRLLPSLYYSRSG